MRTTLDYIKRCRTFFSKDVWVFNSTLIWFCRTVDIHLYTKAFLNKTSQFDLWLLQENLLKIVRISMDKSYNVHDYNKLSTYKYVSFGYHRLFAKYLIIHTRMYVTFRLINIRKIILIRLCVHFLYHILHENSCTCNILSKKSTLSFTIWGLYADELSSYQAGKTVISVVYKGAFVICSELSSESNSITHFEKIFLSFKGWFNCEDSGITMTQITLIYG